MVSRSPSSAAAKKLSPGLLGGLHIKEFAVRQLAERLDRVEEEWNRCADSPGVDEIHDLRVALRRFGETLWLFRRLFPKRERKQVRAELKTVLGYAGAARDVDIAFESFEDACILLSPELRLHLESERAIAEAALVATLAVGRRTRVVERWRRALALLPEIISATPRDSRSPSRDGQSGSVAAAPLTTAEFESPPVIAGESEAEARDVVNADTHDADENESEMLGSANENDLPLPLVAASGSGEVK